ncbi:MAG TPA: hypothetical protein VIG61_03795 [Fusobacterium sp.]|uniref:phage late control D family protein n=1 Tax=Fusobacterium sp. TaxID=68766 RepID=UPI002F4031D6
MGIANNIQVLVFYEGVDISDDIQTSLQSLSYTDNSKNAVDDLELTLENLDYRWLREWYPDENARLTVGIVQVDNEIPRFLNLGTFYVDEPTFQDQTLNLKCLALPTNQNAREQKNSVAWEKITLSELGQKIANKHELQFQLHGEDEFFERLDQDRETDLGFLKRIVGEVALNLKITNDTVLIFDDEEMEKNEVLTTFSVHDSRISSFSLTKKNQAIYDKVEVSYYDADKKQHIREIITKEELEKRNEVTVE